MYSSQFRLLLTAGVLGVVFAPLLVCLQSFCLGEECQTPETSLVKAYVKAKERYLREMDFLSGRRGELFRMSATLRSAGDQASANEYLRIGADSFRMPLAALLLAIVNREGYGLRPNAAHAAFWAQRACELAQGNGDETTRLDALRILKELKEGVHEK